MVRRLSAYPVCTISNKGWFAFGAKALSILKNITHPDGGLICFTLQQKKLLWLCGIGIIQFVFLILMKVSNRCYGVCILNFICSWVWLQATTLLNIYRFISNDRTFLPSAPRPGGPGGPGGPGWPGLPLWPSGILMPAGPLPTSAGWHTPQSPWGRTMWIRKGPFSRQSNEIETQNIYLHLPSLPLDQGDQAQAAPDLPVDEYNIKAASNEITCSIRENMHM